MAKHEVGLEIAQLTSIGRVDIKVPVRSNGKYLGSLHISRGSIDWVVGRATTYGHQPQLGEVRRAHASGSTGAATEDTRSPGSTQAPYLDTLRPR